ncbi:unnamed protein product, partial [Musa textilis]
LQKVVVKVDVHDNKDKKVAMRAVSSLQANKSDLKHWCAEMVSVGPASEPEEEEAKKGEREKEKDADEQVAELVKACQAYNVTVSY